MALDPISAALDIGGKVIDRLWPDPAQAAAAKLELIKLQQSGELAQLAVNTEEAKHPSVFVSGWRPAIGWICGLACAWNWIGLPVVKVALLIWSNRTIPLAPADLTDMLPILVGMLGLSGYRTLERLNGVERK